MAAMDYFPASHALKYIKLFIYHLEKMFIYHLENMFIFVIALSTIIISIAMSVTGFPKCIHSAEATDHFTKWFDMKCWNHLYAIDSFKADPEDVNTGRYLARPNVGYLPFYFFGMGFGTGIFLYLLQLVTGKYDSDKAAILNSANAVGKDKTARKVDDNTVFELYPMFDQITVWAKKCWVPVYLRQSIVATIKLFYYRSLLVFVNFAYDNEHFNAYANYETFAALERATSRVFGRSPKFTSIVGFIGECLTVGGVEELIPQAKVCAGRYCRVPFVSEITGGFLSIRPGFYDSVFSSTDFYCRAMYRDGYELEPNKATVACSVQSAPITNVIGIIVCEFINILIILDFWRAIHPWLCLLCIPIKVKNFHRAFEKAFGNIRIDFWTSVWIVADKSFAAFDALRDLVGFVGKEKAHLLVKKIYFESLFGSEYNEELEQPETYVKRSIDDVLDKIGDFHVLAPFRLVMCLFPSLQILTRWTLKKLLINVPKIWAAVKSWACAPLPIMKPAVQTDPEHVLGSKKKNGMQATIQSVATVNEVESSSRPAGAEPPRPNGVKTQCEGGATQAVKSVEAGVVIRS